MAILLNCLLFHEMNACLSDFVYGLQMMGGETGNDFVKQCQQNWTDCKDEWLHNSRGLGAKASCNINRM